MPGTIKKVVRAVAELRNSATNKIQSLVQANFVRLVSNDAWIGKFDLSHRRESKKPE